MKKTRIGLLLLLVACLIMLPMVLSSHAQNSLDDLLGLDNSSEQPLDGETSGQGQTQQGTADGQGQAGTLGSLPIPAPQVTAQEPASPQLNEIAFAETATDPQPEALLAQSSEDATGLTAGTAEVAVAPDDQALPEEAGGQVQTGTFAIINFPTPGRKLNVVNISTLQGDVPGADSKLIDVNAAGVALGQSSAPGGETHSILFRNGQLVDLETLGGGLSTPTGLNGQQIATGYSETRDGTVRGFIWKPDLNRLITIPTLGGRDNYAADINALGQVTGFSQDASDNFVAFAFSRGKVFRIGTLGGRRSWGLGINRSANICGGSLNSQGQMRAFRFTPRDRMQNLGVISGGNYSIGLVINSKGQIAGISTTPSGNVEGVVWDENNVLTRMGHLGGGNSTPSAINSSGQVVGDSSIGGGIQHAFLYDIATGRIRDLGALTDRRNRSGAKHIGTFGDVVGWSGDMSRPGNTLATIWSPGAQPKDLNDDLPPNSDWDHLAEASRINDDGTIVGFGFTINGDRRGFIAIPQ